VCEYLTVGDSRPDHFGPRNLVSAIKGRTFNGYTDVTIAGRAVRINQSNPGPAIAWAAEQLGPHIAANARGPIALVPIPGHASVAEADVKAGRGFALAKACEAWLIAHRVAAQAIPLLRWTQVMPSAHEEGGSRNPDDLVRFYALAPGMLARAITMHGRTVVLVDDVVTSGARLKAAETFLTTASSARYPVAPVAFAVARTVHIKAAAFAPLLESCPRS